MHAPDVLRYGHATVMRAFEALPLDGWETAGVVGTWSAKNVAAHLASFEQALVELFGSLRHPALSTPTLAGMNQPDFNEEQVALRHHLTPSATLAEYVDWHGQAIQLADSFPAETYCQTGLLGWYGADYDLEDFLVYTYYGHKREHAVQLKLFIRRGEPLNTTT
ncbi:DinB family protein [Deinococcus sp.]|uniref:DinB family protein n=1 Tax=Deinococcus sp. TaxID=47478 RepID=UPI002869BA76|nr:maleylpyruvate isomerase N-terminal domain-containing protein [Deinococcus sp.]